MSQSVEPDLEPASPPPAARPAEAGTLRGRTARGTILNGFFVVATTGIGALRLIVVARFVTPSQYAVWGILVSVLALVWWLKDVGVSDKYIQQTDQTEQEAFQHAFGVNSLIMAACLLLMAGAMPVMSIALGRPALIAPGLVLCAIVPAYAAQFPLVVFERRLQWARVRGLQAIETLAGFVIMILLVAFGLGYWGLLIGSIAGAWLTGLMALALCPFPLRPKLASASLRIYLGFSLPVVLYTGAGLLIAYSIFISGSRSFGLAGIGAITLAGTVASLTDRADAVVTQTLYPAICAVQDRVDLLTESFSKSNRLTLMWGIPFGVGMLLFSPDLVHFVLGRKWDSAIPLMQGLGLIAASHHIAFNWDAFYRARGDTRPLGWAACYIIATTLLVITPLILAFGFTGFIAGMGASQLGYVLLRGWLLKRLLPDLDFGRHVARAIVPSLPAAALIVLVRLIEPRHRTFAIAVAELGLYSLVTFAATWLLERSLLREVYAYVRVRRTAAHPSQTAEELAAALAPESPG